jgi:hypothetical protein
MSIQHWYEYKTEQIHLLSCDLTVGSDWEVRESMIWEEEKKIERNTQ